MVRVIVTAHGRLASTLVESTSQIIGDNPDLVAVDFPLDGDPDGLYAACLAAMGEADEVVFLVDMLGGSPYNAATHCCLGREDCDVLTGANLPMVIDASMRAKQGDAQVGDIVRTAVQAARSSLTSLRDRSVASGGLD